jgi:hypothetical protein
MYARPTKSFSRLGSRTIKANEGKSLLAEYDGGAEKSIKVKDPASLQKSKDRKILL